MKSVCLGSNPSRATSKERRGLCKSILFQIMQVIAGTISVV